MARPAPAVPVHSEGLLPRVLLGLLMILLVYLPNQAQFSIEFGLRGLNVANVLFLLALFTLMLLHRDPSPPTPLKLPLMLFFGALVWALGVALWGDSSAWVEDVTMLKNAVFYPLLYFLYFHAVRDMKWVRMLVLMILFVMLTSGVLGLRQAMFYGVGSYHEFKRVAAPFGWGINDANRAAIFFCIYLQVVAAVALFLRSHGWLRLVCAGIFALGVFVVFHTYSRQAYGVLAVTIVLLLARKHLFMALLAAVLVYHYDAWVPEAVVQRIEMTTLDPYEAGAPRTPPPVFDPLATLNRPSAGPGDPFQPVPPRSVEVPTAEAQYDGSTESRFTLWSGAWEVIQRNPLGVGLHRFPREVSPYVPPDLRGIDAHNYFVLLTTEAGVPALLILVGLLLALLMMGRRLARLGDGDDEARVLGVGFVMATLAVIMGNLYGSRFVNGDVMGIYWILAALVARSALIKEQERRERKSAVPGPAAPGATPVRSARPRAA